VGALEKLELSQKRDTIGSLMLGSLVWVVLALGRVPWMTGSELAQARVREIDSESPIAKLRGLKRVSKAQRHQAEYDRFAASAFPWLGHQNPQQGYCYLSIPSRSC
jgi:hypothetical protein